MSECEGGCCGSQKFDGANPIFRRALLAVILINGTMFVVEMLAGFAGQSMALKADALDFLGDTTTYALSLWAIGRTPAVRARVALLKALSLAGMGLFVLAATLYRFVITGMPDERVMGVVGALALAANLLSLVILVRWRSGDANIRSVWLCTRNDSIGNIAVIGAAALVGLTHSPWPDLIVATLMAGLFLNSSRQIVRQARSELAEQRPVAAVASE